MKKEYQFTFFVLLFFLGAYGVHAGEYAVDEHTVALWHMNEGSGSMIYDETNNTYDGTINGASWVQGLFGSALQFDGNDNVFILNDPYMPMEREVTLEAWIKRDSQQDGTVISKNGPYFIGVYNNKLRGGIYAGSPITWTDVIGSTELSLGVWYHIAITYDGTNIKLFLNGVEDGTTPKTGLMPIVSQNVYLGWGEPGQNQYFHGVIDEVRISDIARTSFEPDADGDTIEDSVDNCPYTYNKFQYDFDRDHVGDWCDNCPLTSNTDQLDDNHNEKGNACETLRYQCRAFQLEIGDSK